MALIKAVGGHEYEVNREKAKQIKLLKWGDEDKGIKPQAPNSQITISGATFSLREIRMVDLNKGGEIPAYRDVSAMDHDKTTERVKKRNEQVAKWTPYEKTKRMLKTYCYLAFKAKGNKGGIDEMGKDPLCSMLMEPINKWFEENETESICPKDVYYDIIPTQKKEAVAGFTKLF